MSKNRINNLAEQLANKRNVSKKSNEVREAEEAQGISTKVADQHGAIELRAYQIHLEKGGSDLDNWLEAERCSDNNDKAISRLINEGDPNIQK